ncbi:MAG: polysaccharide deacetylase family protein, partial [Halobacteriaceae archaeon]
RRPMTDGRLVLVFDDGYAEDYERVAPVLREADAPACFAVVPGWLGDEGHLTESRLAELVDAGCEVAAHGVRHRRLQATHLAADAAAGDARAVVDGPVFPDDDHGVVVGDEYELTDGSRRERRELVDKGETDDAQYVAFDRPLESAFAAGEAVLRPSEATLRDEVVGAGEDLRALGFDPRTFVFPYDAADPRAWSLAAERYDAVANAAVRSLPNSPGTAPTDLRRYYLETTHLTEVEVAEYLDAVAARGGLGILAGHSAWDSVPPERVARVVELARERGVAVTTFREAFEAGGGR